MIAMRCIPSRWIPLFSKLSSLPVMAPHRISLEAALRYMATQLLLVPILMTTPEGQMPARLTYLCAEALPELSKPNSLPVMALHRISLDSALRYIVTQLFLVPFFINEPAGHVLSPLSLLCAVALPGFSKPSSLPVMALHPISLDSALRYMATQHLLAPRWMTTPEGQMLARPTYLYAVALSGLSKPNSLPVMVRPRIS